jgi:predicted ATPase
LRGAFDIRGDEPLSERRSTLIRRLAQRIGAAEQQTVAELLGEIMGVPFSGEDSALLRSARRDPQVMSHEMCQAWVDFLGAECSVQPVLLILENLHWGDWPTVRFVDRALHDLMKKPWMVLAVARPEVHERFSNLWEGRHIHEIRLTPLRKRASEQWVRQALGDRAGAEMVERLIALSGGHPFYLQEMIRAAAQQNGEGLPEAVVEVEQRKLGALDAEDRRVLRAASLFGEVFWLGGVAALLGGAEQAAQVQSRLLGLVDVVARRPESRFAGENEFAFRHVLLREAAYAMLTDADRILGQRLAFEWLLSRGESEPQLPGRHGMPGCGAG